MDKKEIVARLQSLVCHYVMTNVIPEDANAFIGMTREDARALSEAADIIKEVQE